MFDIARKVTLITSGVQSIGLAYTKQLLKNVIKALTLVDINAKLGREVTDNLSKSIEKSDILFIEADISNRIEFESKTPVILWSDMAKFNHLDIVINNAGKWNELTSEQMIDVNKGTTVGTLLAFEKYLPKYKKGDEGVIVNTSSLAGIIPVFFTPVYSATKHSIVALTRTLGVDPYYQRTNIRIMTLCAGSTDTPMCSVPLNKCLHNFQISVMDNFMEKVSTQSADDVAKTLIEAIKKGKK